MPAKLQRRFGNAVAEQLSRLLRNEGSVLMSDKPIAERLQVKGERSLAVVGAPAAVDRKIGAKNPRSDIAKADVILLFAANRAAFDAAIPATLKKLQKTAILWVAYPKLTSQLAADLSRDIIHALAPKHGLDTVSQIAIDDDWSALRLKRLG
jgi:hypothetical protein